jgi:hypothetical protein
MMTNVVISTASVTIETIAGPLGDWTGRRADDATRARWALVGADAGRN